jgi:hypothetical protein
VLLAPLLHLLLACARAPAPPAGPAGVALITIDTWRADHLSPQHSPHLWALAEQGVRYTDAWSPQGLTSPAHATMLTGRMPWEHGLRANNHHGYQLDPTVPLVHETLGLPAGAFVSAYPAGPEGGLSRGFDVFDGPESGERPGSVAVERALAWLPTDRPAFLWVHLYEPHGPYEGRGATDPERYAEEVARADAALAPLLDELTRRGSRIVVAGDHGEVLLEEPCGRQHERSIHEVVLHVPLFTWAPGLSPAVVSQRVGLSDVPALLRGQAPAGRAAVLAESGLCEPGCAPGCAPPGLAGRDAVGLDAGGRWIRRPGRGTWAEGAPAAELRARIEAIPPVPLPHGAAPEEAAVLGYVE